MLTSCFGRSSFNSCSSSSFRCFRASNSLRFCCSSSSVAAVLEAMLNLVTFSADDELVAKVAELDIRFKNKNKYVKNKHQCINVCFK